MPYRVRKQDCTKSDGGSGSHVVQKKSGGKWTKASCHSSKEKASAAIRVRNMNEDDEAIEEHALLRWFVRDLLLKEYVSAADQDPKSMHANADQRQVILDLLEQYDDIPEVAEFLDVVSGADRNALTAPKHDRYFIQDDVDHVVTALKAGGFEKTAKRMDDIDFREYFI